MVACSSGVQQYMPAVLGSAPARSSAAAAAASPARAAHVSADVAYLSHELARAPAASSRATTPLCARPAAHTSELQRTHAPYLTLPLKAGSYFWVAIFHYIAFMFRVQIH